MTGLRIEKLARAHPVDAFACGVEALDRYLHRFAWQNQQANAAQTYVGLSGQAIVGFYTLAVGEVAYERSAERMRKGLARHPVPVMLLARLAVHQEWRGRGIGAGLLKDALVRTARAADFAGIRAFVVHAKDDQAQEFYEHFGFQPSPSDPLHLFMLLKDIPAV